ncbi:hypothetical protein [Phytohabitans rumicis]|uniref:hypothetical protein n=1 Tax=Phytohabitans rumicis TaxID=1076125 RepID=UPI0015634629|nr:hypothetical protein [Phytohabitans rumicis]
MRSAYPASAASIRPLAQSTRARPRCSAIEPGSAARPSSYSRAAPARSPAYQARSPSWTRQKPMSAVLTAAASAWFIRSVAALTMPRCSRS